MKKHLLNLRAIALSLCCLLGLASAMAQAVTPEVGKVYRIRNIRAATYLTMSASSSTTVTASDIANSEYQFWTVSEGAAATDGTPTYRFLNVGWENAGTKAYIYPNSTTSGGTIRANTSAGASGSWRLNEGTFNNYTPAYNITLRANASLGIYAGGTSPTLYDATDAGSWWVFEEAALVKPQIVYFKSSRSGKYIYEKQNGLWQQSNRSDAGQWIIYTNEDGKSLFINNATHNIIQQPANNVTVATSPTQTWLCIEEKDGEYIIGQDNFYLNERNSNDVCGYKNGWNDAGNIWKKEVIGEMDESEVIEILQSNSPYARSVENGKLYRLYNETRTGVLYENYSRNTLVKATENENDYTQVWRAVVSGTDNVKWQNVVTERYISLGSGTSAAASPSTVGSTFTFARNTAVSEMHYYWNFSVGTYAMHLNSSGELVNWYAGTKDVSASEWLLCEVTSVDENTLSTQQAEYQAVAAERNEFNNMKTHTAEYQAVLDQVFANKACTELSAEAQAMNDEEFGALIASLPQILQDLCWKVKNDTWERSIAGNNWEKFFRAAEYPVYSKSTQMCWVVGTSNAFSRLSNPTGIFAPAGTTLAIMSSSGQPANATLCVELVASSDAGNPRTGEQTTLKEGLNLIFTTEDVDVFVYYEVNGWSDESKYYLENFPDALVHIEGGTVNGYFDLTRNMTDAQWADMTNSGLLSGPRVQVKGSHVVCNWPKSQFVPRNSTKVVDMANFYNNIPKWEQEIMGINDTYLSNISKRYRNVYTAVGADLGDSYMYSTTYGTFYNYGTLGDILSTNVLSNGGNQWGPAHEFGHNHQALFNMVGCTEVSNNVFSNAVVYKMGAAMSRGVGLSELIPRFAYKNGNLRDASSINSLTTTENSNWMDLGIWCKTQMYWKLYQYFHLAGYDPEFYPKVFNIMRSNGLKHSAGNLVQAATDYLHFAEVCCEAADADLSEFFEMYCFYRPLTTDTEKNGVACRYVGDYSDYYLYATDAMIQKTLAYCKSFPKKIKNIGFIDDRIRATPATYPGAPAGKMRTGMNGGGDNSVGTEGTLGMYLDYYPENYVQADGYTVKTARSYSDGRAYFVINNDGQGAVGFKVYDSNDNLVFFYNDFTFTVPASVADKFGCNRDNIIVFAADAQGRDYVVYTGSNYTGSLADGIITPNAAKNTPKQTYDLQGRAVNGGAHGLLIVDGKKVIR